MVNDNGSGRLRRRTLRTGLCKRIIYGVIFNLFVLSLGLAQVSKNVELIGTIGQPYIKRPMMVRIVGNYAYIADQALPGLVIFNVFNPAYPAFKGFAKTSAKAWDVDVVGNYAYVAACEAGLIIFDVSDPANPDSVGACVTTDGSLYGGRNSDSRGVKVYGDYAYVGDSYGGLTVIDVSDPTDPVKVANIGDPTLPSMQVHRLDVDGPYCYAAAEEGMLIVDIGDPLAPTIIGSITWEIISGWYRARGVRVFGKYAYLSYGVRIIDISDPTNPKQVGSYLGPHDYRNGWDNKTVASSSSLLYNFYAATHSLRVLDISNPKFPQEVGYYSDKEGVPKGRGIEVVTKPDAFFIYMAGEDPDGICIFRLTETGVKEKAGPRPVSYALHQNYPNPFNPVTIIKYQLARSGWVSLKVYNTLGDEVASLVDAQQLAGSYQVKFDASHLTTGIYFYRLESGAFRQVRKMVIIK